MDIDRNKINEMKSECLQMPDYIRDMIGRRSNSS